MNQYLATQAAIQKTEEMERQAAMEKQMALEKKKADEHRMAIEAQVNMEMYMKEKENMIRRSISPNRTNSLTMRTSGTHETKNYTYYTTSGAANLADIKL